MTTTTATQSGKTGLLPTDTEYNGRVVRLAMYMTHYRKPLDWTQQRLLEASKTLNKFLKHAQYEDKAVLPVPFLEAITNDLNIVQAIVIMHQLCQKKEYGKLWCCMDWLGLLPNTIPKEIDELKLLPKEENKETKETLII